MGGRNAQLECGVLLASGSQDISNPSGHPVPLQRLSFPVKMMEKEGKPPLCAHRERGCCDPGVSPRFPEAGTQDGGSSRAIPWDGEGPQQSLGCVLTRQDPKPHLQPWDNFPFSLQLAPRRIPSSSSHGAEPIPTFQASAGCLCSLCSQTPPFHGHFLLPGGIPGLAPASFSLTPRNRERISLPSRGQTEKRDFPPHSFPRAPSSSGLAASKQD